MKRNILYFIEYMDRIYAHCSSGKMVPVTDETFGKYHYIIAVTDNDSYLVTKEMLMSQDKYFHQISYRKFSDNHISKFIKEKILKLHKEITDGK